jgi:hypothetical protein
MASPPPPPTPLDDFVALSVILTGIASDKLKPFLDTYGTAEEYLVYATANGGPAFKNMMALFDANRSLPPEQIGELIFDNPDTSIAYIAKTVMLMWYLGSWYPPDVLQKYHADPVNNFPSSIVISSNAYTQGWAWRVGQTHPMGYSDWRFGYWNAPPPPLSDFIGD